MPRLLLVDDNPSIHKIAETLLATSSIELVCVDSAAAALEKVNRGEHFDVALVDISMAGMDGWGLLAKLRELPATAQMPIAMMAGVLDTVDPERITQAPIQGFLKKPVELRELGDRVIRLMETPVPLPEPPAPVPVSSPYATMPATHLDDLPEFRQKQAAVEDDILELTEEDLYPEPVETLVESADESLELEELDLASLQGLPEQPEILLAPTPVAVTAAVPDHSEPTPQEWAWPAEALDAISTLDRLPAPALVEQPELPHLVPSAEVDLPDLGAPSEELMDISSLSNLPEIEEIPTAERITAPDIPLASLLEDSREETSFTPPLPPLEESLDWSDDSESMLATVEAAAPGPVADAMSPSEEELDLLDVSVPELALEPSTLQLDLEEAVPFLEEALPFVVPKPLAPVSAEAVVHSALLESAAAPAAEPAPVPAVVPEPLAPVSAEAVVHSALLESAAAPAAEPAPVPAVVPSLGSKELLDAMMSDPLMMDALAKAVVARLGDQVLREIAWEVIPELAERLPRN